MPYRKLKHGETWHWCRNCSHWPEQYFDVKLDRPKGGESCKECEAKERDGECQS